jgi:hypothetical protein
VVVVLVAAGIAFYNQGGGMVGGSHILTLGRNATHS